MRCGIEQRTMLFLYHLEVHQPPFPLLSGGTDAAGTGLSSSSLLFQDPQRRHQQINEQNQNTRFGLKKDLRDRCNFQASLSMLKKHDLNSWKVVVFVSAQIIVPLSRLGRSWDQLSGFLMGPGPCLQSAACFNRPTKISRHILSCSRRGLSGFSCRSSFHPDPSIPFNAFQRRKSPLEKVGWSCPLGGAMNSLAKKLPVGALMSTQHNDDIIWTYVGFGAGTFRWSILVLFAFAWHFSSVPFPLDPTLVLPGSLGPRSQELKL